MTRLVLLITLLFIASRGFTQQVATDSLVAQKAKENTFKAYHNFLGNDRGLYNGPMYNEYLRIISDGNPFLDSTKPSTGWVSYNGIVYEQVPLLYDILKTKVITVTPATQNMLELISSRVDSFYLLNHKFVRLGNTEPVPAGFYEVLFKGNTHALYKLHVKELQENTSSGALRRIIYDINQFYVQNNGSFYRITSKKSLLNAYRDHRKDVQVYLRRHKLKVRKNKDADLPVAAAYYESISKTVRR